MTIKIDMDGVIRDIIPTMLKIYNEECDGQLTANDIIDYNVNTSFPNVITKKNKLATDFFFVDKAEDIFRYSPMCNGAKEAINMLHRAGHKIVICTWQFTHEAKVYTLEFLKANEIYYDDICFTKEKDLIKSDVIVDDIIRGQVSINSSRLTIPRKKYVLTQHTIRITRNVSIMIRCITLYSSFLVSNIFCNFKKRKIVY